MKILRARRLVPVSALPALLVVLCAIPSPADADVITFAFTGTVYAVSDSTFRPYSELGVAVGTTLTGQFTWDPDSRYFGWSPDRSEFGGVVLSYTVGDFTMRSDPGEMFAPEVSGDRAYWNIIFDGGGIFDAWLDLTSDRPEDVTTGAEGWRSPDATLWNGGHFGIDLPDPSSLHATITEVRRVPEPASLLLLGTGLAVAGLVGRRRRGRNGRGGVR